MLLSNGDAMMGASIDLGNVGGRLDAVLFGETQSRIVSSCSRDHPGLILQSGLPVPQPGMTGEQV